MLFAFVGLFLPFYANAETADVGFVGVAPKFSKEVMYVGDTIRVYARVRNNGDVDIYGTVGFYLGDILLGNEQPFSAPKAGFDEEVFTDFTVPTGAFNVAARINSTTPTDIRVDDNYIQSTQFIPIPDDDRDGVLNANDNCSKISNADQKDTDKDGEGDACDIDDDNDTITDEMEINELGTDPVLVDTDKDGKQDANDKNPTVFDAPADATTANESGPAKKTTSQTNTEPEMSVFKKLFNINKITEAPQAVATIQANAIDELTPHLSPKASFSIEKVQWNVFRFTARQNELAPVSASWDFGDGAKSAEVSVLHIFPGAGNYDVRLSVTNENGEIDEDGVRIEISMFHLGNPVFLAFIAILSILLFLSFAALFRLPKHE